MAIVLSTEPPCHPKNKQYCFDTYLNTLLKHHRHHSAWLGTSSRQDNETVVYQCHPTLERPAFCMHIDPEFCQSPLRNPNPRMNCRVPQSAPLPLVLIYSHCNWIRLFTQKTNQVLYPRHQWKKQEHDYNEKKLNHKYDSMTRFAGSILILEWKCSLLSCSTKEYEQLMSEVYRIGRSRVIQGNPHIKSHLITLLMPQVIKKMKINAQQIQMSHLISSHTSEIDSLIEEAQCWTRQKN